MTNIITYHIYTILGNISWFISNSIIFITFYEFNYYTIFMLFYNYKVDM
jgi:hypothetical protein